MPYITNMLDLRQTDLLKVNSTRMEKAENNIINTGRKTPVDKRTSKSPDFKTMYQKIKSKSDHNPENEEEVNESGNVKNKKEDENKKEDVKNFSPISQLSEYIFDTLTINQGSLASANTTGDSAGSSIPGLVGLSGETSDTDSLILAALENLTSEVGQLGIENLSQGLELTGDIKTAEEINEEINIAEIDNKALNQDIPGKEDLNQYNTASGLLDIEENQLFTGKNNQGDFLEGQDAIITNDFTSNNIDNEVGPGSPSNKTEDNGTEIFISGNRQIKTEMTESKNENSDNEGAEPQESSIGNDPAVIFTPVHKSGQPENSQEFSLHKNEELDFRENLFWNTDKDAILKQVIDKARVFFEEDKTEMIINLKPESLGKLSLKVVSEKGMVEANFIAENYQVKEILETNMNLLKDVLEKQGIIVQNFSVSVGDFSSGNSRREDGFIDDKIRASISPVYSDISDPEDYLVANYQHADKLHDIYSPSGRKIDLMA